MRLEMMNVQFDGKHERATWSDSIPDSSRTMLWFILFVRDIFKVLLASAHLSLLDSSRTMLEAHWYSAMTLTYAAARMRLTPVCNDYNPISSKYGITIDLSFLMIIN